MNGVVTHSWECLEDGSSFNFSKLTPKFNIKASYRVKKYEMLFF